MLRVKIRVTLSFMYPYNSVVIHKHFTVSLVWQIYIHIYIYGRARVKLAYFHYTLLWGYQPVNFHVLFKLQMYLFLKVREAVMNSYRTFSLFHYTKRKDLSAAP